MGFVQIFVNFIDEKLRETNTPFTQTLEQMKKDLLQEKCIGRELFDSDIIKEIFLTYIDETTKFMESSMQERGVDLETKLELNVLKLMKKDLLEKSYIEKRRWTELPSG